MFNKVMNRLGSDVLKIIYHYEHSLHYNNVMNQLKNYHISKIKIDIVALKLEIFITKMQLLYLEFIHSFT